MSPPFNVYASMARIGDVWNEKRIVAVMPHRNQVRIFTVPAAGGTRGQLSENVLDAKDRIELRTN